MVSSSGIYTCTDMNVTVSATDNLCKLSFVTKSSQVVKLLRSSLFHKCGNLHWLRKIVLSRASLDRLYLWNMCYEENGT